MSINPPAGPVPSPPGPPYPAIGPASARAHVRRLRQDGRTYRAIAAAAGLDRATVSDLARGRRRPHRGTATAVLTVTSQAVPRGCVDAGGSRLRLRALHVMGHGSARIARALGVREMTIRQIVRGDTLDHPEFGGDSILPRCSGLGGRCLPRYRRLAEPRSDHFSAFVLSNICPAALSSCPARWRAPPARPPLGPGHLLVGHPGLAPRVPRAGQG